ncbi:hypothetical protein IWW50_001760, partial [Coemansia erecta]
MSESLPASEPLANMFDTSSKGMNAHWSEKVDYAFATILAENTACSDQGLTFQCRFVDCKYIKEVSDGLLQELSPNVIAESIAAKHSTKLDQKILLDSIEFLALIKRSIPNLSYGQINHRHTNMWTRIIVPFRQVFASGAFYKSKSMFHRDCKRSAKLLVQFMRNIIATGIESADLDMFNKPGKTIKLMDLWLTAMLRMHKQKMLMFLESCSKKLAFTYL